jgi:branched-subunit amino acid transport protein
MFLNLLAQRPFYSPAILEPFRYGQWMNTALFRPIAQKLFAALISEPHITASIPRLLRSSSPLAVISRVVAVVIYSLDKRIDFSVFSNMRFVAIVHIVLKLFKRRPFAFNASRSVVSVGWPRLTPASSVHFLPYVIKARVTHPVYIMYHIKLSYHN